MKNKVLALVLSGLFTGISAAQHYIDPEISSGSSFAIIVDPDTFEAAKNEILAYKHSVESDGLGTYVIYDNWRKPDDIRKVLKNLYEHKQHPLEGAVFMGDIPIPMIRGAQQLTSTFKMPEKVRWEASSVASDRFYDDFDLEFEYLKQDEDTTRTRYHYYNLASGSPHYISMDIYSARMLPPVSGDRGSAVEQLKAYLQKLVRIREEKNPLNDMIVSTGHGYNSDAMSAWGGEVMALRTSFPELLLPENSLKFLNYRNAVFMKEALLTELRRDDLDLAFMTGHGTVDAQFINGYPDVSNPQPSMENVGRYIRSKMNNARDSGKDLEATKQRYQEWLGLNDKWFADAFEASRTVEDSVFNAALDIHSTDLRQVNARVAYLNSCLTGSFHKGDYLAGYYPFSQGKNVVAIANTIGVLQDLWGMELLGILHRGVRVGHLLKKTAYLETHILGDPTFHFAAEESDKYNTLFGARKTTEDTWQKLLEIQDADLQAYALTELWNKQEEEKLSEKLSDLFRTSPYEAVRTQAYFLLRRYNNGNFRQVLKLALRDNHEYIRRKAIYDVIELGATEYIGDIIDNYIYGRHLKRIRHKINWSFQCLDKEVLLKELHTKLYDNTAVYNGKELYDSAVTRITAEKKKTEELIALLGNPDTPRKELNYTLRNLRAYRYHEVIPAVIKIVKNEKMPQETRLSALEALSWYGWSYTRNDILQLCETLVKGKEAAEIKKRAQKTLQTIKDASRRPF